MIPERIGDAKLSALTLKMDALIGNQLCNVTFAPSVITLPASIGLLLIAPVRIFQLRNESVKVSFGKLAYAKLVSFSPIGTWKAQMS